MRSVGVRELKEQLSQILQRVRSEDEVIEITYYGEVVAHLVPARKTPVDAEKVEAVLTDLDTLAAEIGQKWQGEPSAVEAIREVRREL